MLLGSRRMHFFILFSSVSRQCPCALVLGISEEFFDPVHASTSGLSIVKIQTYDSSKNPMPRKVILSLLARARRLQDPKSTYIRVYERYLRLV